MKKKLLALILVVALAVTTIVGGTLAYQVDTEAAVNVAVVGMVDVELIEQQRGESGLEPFEDAKVLMPIVGSAQGEKDDYGMPVAANYVDKIVRVENTGNQPAWVRVIVAIPAALEGGSADQNALHWNLGNRFDPKGGKAYNDGAWAVAGNPYFDDFGNPGYELVENVVIDGMEYNLYTFTTAAPVQAGDTTAAVMSGFYLDSAVDYDDETGKWLLGDQVIDYDLAGGVVIPVYAQAVQSAGFESAEVAFNSAFGGAISAQNHPWLQGVNAPVVVEDAEALVAALTAGDSVMINEDITVNEAISLPENSDVLMIVNADVTVEPASGSAITVPAGSKLEIVGGGSLTAISASGSGIGVAAGGEVSISGLSDLVAEGEGKHAYGIGGSGATVTITDTHIESVVGGYDDFQHTDADKYDKQAPEGGAAIGGEVIVLDNVTIENAVGGSKSAGIGATFWQKTDITITNSTIKNVEGGVSAAAIGGSRISNSDGNNTWQTTTITIVDSEILNAQGGYYAAGIGSGYDTYCHAPEFAPLCTIYIKGDSVINATGGKYAAGIGTGHHAIGLAGEIEQSVTVTAASGEKFYKDTYTQAQDVGFGVIDPTREGLNNTSGILYGGVMITVPAV